MYEKAYANEPFVHVLPEKVFPTTGSVVGSAQAMPTHVQGGGTGTAITDVRDMPGDSMIAS